MEHCLSQLTAGLSPESLLQQLINGLALGSIYALLALGYSMVYGVLELINFAHGDVFMVGTFVIFGVINLAHAGPGTSLVILLPVLLLATLVAMAACSILGFTIEKVAYRPLRNAPRLAPLISAIGVSFILSAWVTTYVSDRDHRGPEDLPRQRPGPDLSIGYQDQLHR